MLSTAMILPAISGVLSIAIILPYISGMLSTAIILPAISGMLSTAIILPEISGMLSTVPVTSLVAYSFLSAGTNASVCPTIQHPTFSKISNMDSAL